MTILVLIDSRKLLRKLDQRMRSIFPTPMSELVDHLVLSFRRQLPLRHLNLSRLVTDALLSGIHPLSLLRVHVLRSASGDGCEIPNIDIVVML